MPSVLIRRSVVAVLALAIPTVASTAGPARAATRHHVVALAGGSHDLVYGRTSDGVHASVRVRNGHGSTRSLGAFRISGRDATRFTVNANTVVGIVTNAKRLDPRVVRWWDLKHHRSGTFRLPAGAFADGAVPGGVLFEVPYLADPSRPNVVKIKKFGGKATTLPHPFGSDRDLAYVAAPHGVVAVDYDRATAAMKYARYGHGFRRLAGGGTLTSSDQFTCYAPSASLITCTKALTGGRTTGYGVPLNGHKAIVVPSSHPVAVGSAVVYRSGRLVFRSAAGRVRHSSAHGTPVAEAFGDLVLTNHAHTRLSRLTGPKAKPRRLV